MKGLEQRLIENFTGIIMLFGASWIGLVVDAMLMQ